VQPVGEQQESGANVSTAATAPAAAAPAARETGPIKVRILHSLSPSSWSGRSKWTFGYLLGDHALAAPGQSQEHIEGASAQRCRSAVHAHQSLGRADLEAAEAQQSICWVLGHDSARNNTWGGRSGLQKSWLDSATKDQAAAW
jgi:hypothetical protein